MKLSVLIPTYGRSADFDRCLSGLAQQERQADQIVVVLRSGDESSARVVSRWHSVLPIVTKCIAVPGVVQALNLGLTAIDGDILIITDDDSEAFPDWLGRIETHFKADAGLGGLGGRDIVFQNGSFVMPTKRIVGRILPYGRVVGNHHIGKGGPRRVHHLKGVNMSWRMKAIGGRRFDEDVRGSGAQVSFELAFSWELLSRGWRILYDPEVKVYHFPGRRFGSEQRAGMSIQICEDHSFNFYLSLFRYLKPGWTQKSALLWAWTIGTLASPGWARGIAFRLKGNTEGVLKRKAAKRAWEAAKKLVYEAKASV